MDFWVTGHKTLPKTSQGSAATHLIRCGWIADDDFVKNLLQSLKVKEFWKSYKR